MIKFLMLPEFGSWFVPLQAISVFVELNSPVKSVWSNLYVTSCLCAATLKV